MSTHYSREDMEKIVALLESSGDYRILRRMDPNNLIDVDYDAIPPERRRRAIFLDAETTGLDTSKDEVIELGMVPFEYSLDGQVVRVHDPLIQLNEPSHPLSDEVKRVTGIDDAMLAGHKLDTDEIEAVADQASLIVAHNAAFDRKMLERVSPVFSRKPWACSMSQIEWKGEGVQNTRLEGLANHYGYFFDSHRVDADCHAGISLLCLPLLSQDNQHGLQRLLKNARENTYYVEASEAPFDMKDSLKERGYLWNPGDRSTRKHWWAEVPEDAIEEEMEWLGKNIYRRSVDHLRVNRITPLDRFSDRASSARTRWADVKQESFSFTP